MNIMISYSKPLHLNRIDGKEMRSVYMWKDCEYLVFSKKHFISLNKSYSCHSAEGGVWLLIS